MISVIVPIFRNGASILRCLHSINESSNSTGIRTEVALIFDGPNEDSRHVINAWKASPLVSMRIVEIDHAGTAAARNAGIAITTAPQVTFLDADDEMLPARLEYSRNAAKGVLAFGCQKVIGPSALPPGIHSSVTRNGMIPYLTSMIVARETLNGLDKMLDGVRLSDDWDLVIRARERGVVIRLVEDFWAVRHVHEQNASHDTALLASEYVSALRAHLQRKRLARLCDESYADAQEEVELHNTYRVSQESPPPAT